VKNLSIAANLPVYRLSVEAYSDAYGWMIAYPWIKIDGDETEWADVTQGFHTVEVEDSVWDPYQGMLYFDRFTYDSTTDYSNPMTIYVSEEVEVTAHYVGS
jgi:hypothetical protein